MSIYEKFRQEAKLDSRRFGKSILCKILYGEDIGLLYNAGVVPKGINLNKTTGLDPINNKMIAMPLVKYEEYQKLFQNQNNENPSIVDKDTDTIDVDSMSILLDSLDRKVKFLKQNMILVQLDLNVPEGRQAGLNPEVYGVLVDSIDVNQCVNGYYTTITAQNLRVSKDLRS